jgi:hypothetical protein
VSEKDTVTNYRLPVFSSQGQHVPERMVATSAVRYEGPYRRLHEINSQAPHREQIYPVTFLRESPAILPPDMVGPTCSPLYPSLT